MELRLLLPILVARCSKPDVTFETLEMLGKFASGDTMAVTPTISHLMCRTRDKGVEAAAMDMACAWLPSQERFDLHEVDFQKRGVTQNSQQRVSGLLVGLETLIIDHRIDPDAFSSQNFSLLPDNHPECGVPLGNFAMEKR